MQPTDPDVENPGEQPLPPSTNPSLPVDESQLDDEREDYITWQASEYLQHDNGPLWFIVFFAVIVALIGFSILFQAWLFLPVIILGAVAAIVHIRRPPDVIQYRLSDAGFEINKVLYPYSAYKSFSVIRDGAFYAILLIPARRIAASTIVYFDEQDGEVIVDAFGARLPMEHRGLDTVDRFLRLIRF